MDGRILQVFPSLPWQPAEVTVWPYLADVLFWPQQALLVTQSCVLRIWGMAGLGVVGAEGRWQPRSNVGVQEQVHFLAVFPETMASLEF